MAIDPSAILQGRAPGRASIGVILGIVFASVCLLVILTFDAVTGGGSFLVGLLLALLPVAVWLPLVLALDRLEPEPPNALIFAFLWGAGVAATGALPCDAAFVHPATSTLTVAANNVERIPSSPETVNRVPRRARSTTRMPGCSRGRSRESGDAMGQ